MALVENDDGVDARDILHEYAWLEIFKRVYDPKDLESLYNTCVPFRNLLERQKWRWSINLIIPHIAPFLSTERINDDDISPLISVAGLVSDRIWTGLLNLRLISKIWCEAVDDFLSSHCDRKMAYCKRRHRLIHDFGTTEAIAAFQQRFRNWGTNPFPGRAIAFSSQQWIDNEYVRDVQLFPFWGRFRELENAKMAYIRKNLELMQEFGQHIHSLVLGPDCLPEDPRARCETLRNLLLHLPNLKNLVFPPYSDHLLRNENQAVANYLIENPFPPLPHLEAFGITALRSYRGNGYFGASFPIFYRPIIANWARQITTISILELSDPSTRQLLQDMPRLQNLKVTLVPKNLNFDHLRQLPPTLETLHVMFCAEGRSPQIFLIDRFLQAIRLYPLKALRIQFVTPLTSITIIESGQLSLDMYRNESIEFFILDYIKTNMTISFNFLEALRKVQVIKISEKWYAPNNWAYIINRCYHPPEALPERIQLYRPNGGSREESPYRVDMYESNIWEILPSLKTLHFGRRHTEYLDSDLHGMDNDDDFLAEREQEHRAETRVQVSYSRDVYEWMRN